MSEYFAPPPYYYKQFTTSKEYIAPNLDLIQKHVDDFYSFGKFHNFKDYEENKLEQLSKVLEQHKISGNLKNKLKILSQDIFSICIKIQESFANVDNDHIQLRQQLEEKTEQFNLICKFLNQKQKYAELESIYLTEIQKLNKINQELLNKGEEFQQTLNEIIEEQNTFEYNE